MYLPVEPGRLIEDALYFKLQVRKRKKRYFKAALHLNFVR